MKKILTGLFCLASFLSFAQDSSYTRTEIIYGRKDGMALTMIEMTPKMNAKGKAIISLVSGNWISSYANEPRFEKQAVTYVNSDYTVFMVMHGSQPRYSIQDEIADIRRAVRFIRYNAKNYGIDADHIGITGSSSGGHLALMTALADDNIKTNGVDAVDHVSSRVQAAAVFFPPTDFLNWGAQNTGADRERMRKFGVAAAFDFKKIGDSTGWYEHITDEATVKKIAMETSPVYAVSSDDPPVMITHGDADPVVPLQQSQLIIEKLKAAKVPNEFILKPGGGHGWRDTDAELKKFIEWFDKYLK